MKNSAVMNVIIAIFFVNFSVSAGAINNNYIPALSDSNVQYYLNNPISATASRYQEVDSAGNVMDVPSIIQMTGQAYKYAAVYHTPVCVQNCNSASPIFRYKLNLAASNDLTSWTFIRQLVDNADMPRIAQVSGSSWILLTHEQWQGATSASTAPCKVAFELFYDFNDLMSGTIRSTWVQPNFASGYNLNGTPSIYEAHLAFYNGWYSVDGQYGFHYNVSSTATPTDVHAVTTILKLFDPPGGVVGYPSTATNYNNLMVANGAIGAVGERDTLLTTTARFNLQEVHIGTTGADWDKWRVWLYKFSETTNYPTGAGTVTKLAPVTPNGSRSFGGPSVTVVDRPDGSGKAIVICYFIFGEGAGDGEAGSLIYYYNI
jgi:hypothetical protein